MLAYFLFAIVILGLRYWVLPQDPQYKEQLEALVSKSLGERTTIGAIATGWGRFHPTLDIADLKLHDRAGNVALSFAKVGVEVSWQSLFVGGLRLHSIVLERPALRVQRSRDGIFSVAGFEIPPAGESTSGAGIGDWLLRQGELVISQGTVEWIDDARNAPPLVLTDVNFRLVNDLTGLHRFALKAAPPPHLAAAIDVRGHFRGDSLGDVNQVRVDLFAELQYADLAGWTAWVDYPFALTEGRGAIRMWSTVEEGKIAESTVDVALAGVAMRLATDLPVLALARLEGRLGVREIRKGQGFLGLSTRRSTGYRVFGENVVLALAPNMQHVPTSFSLQWERSGTGEAGGTGNAPVATGADRGELRASVLELAPLAEIAEALPLPAPVRRLLIAHQPQGTLNDVAIAWTGLVDAPASYQLRTRFAGIGFKENGQIPGLTGLAGTLEGSHRGGNIALAGERVTISYPRALRWSEALEFDSLGAQIAWMLTKKDDVPQLEVKISSLRLANREVTLAGNIAWHSMPDAPGFIDLDVRIPTAQLAAIFKYIPGLDEKPAIWLKSALGGGSATDGRVRIKGEIFHFPFAGGQHGMFQVNAKAHGVAIKVAPDFPPYQDVDGHISFQGTALDVHASRGRFADVEIGATHVRSPDLNSSDPLLLVDSTAAGPATDFLRYVAESPLKETIGDALGTLKAQGRGRLVLALKLPLQRPGQAESSGSFEFLANDIVLGPNDPAVNKLTGKINFQDQAVNATGLTAEYLGGPVRIDLAMRDGSTQLTAQGSVGMDNLKNAYPIPYGEYATGTARYSALMKSSPNTYDLTIESTLQGVQVALPAPFGKTADAPMPFKLERNVMAVPGGKGPPTRNQMQVAIGPQVNVLARFRTDNGANVLDRATVLLGNAKAALPERQLVTVHGDLKSLDLDQLLPVLRKSGAVTGTPPIGSNPVGSIPIASIPIGPINMRLAELIVAGRRLREAQFRVDLLPDGWAASVQSKEVAGDLRWIGAGDGRMTARFKQLTLPESITPEGAPETSTLRELPALDIFVESFSAHGKRFGRFELDATNESAGWRINKATLSAPEGRIYATGLWQPPDRGDRTEFDVAVEVSDIGGYLERIGHPGAMAGSKAMLEGKFAWQGRPTTIHYPTLSGNLTLKAESGRFLKAEPGIARLLGVLSLQSLPRRVSLDFRDVFSEGFSFDDITATATIAKGIMNTTAFRMVGPAAGVGIAGDIDLDKETQALRVRVVPIIGDSVAAVAGLALLNPLVGLGSFIAQRLLKDPIGQLLAHEYAITGSWDDPKVERVSIFRAPNSTGGESVPQ